MPDGLTYETAFTRLQQGKMSFEELMNTDLPFERKKELAGKFFPSRRVYSMGAAPPGTQPGQPGAAIVDQTAQDIENVKEIIRLGGGVMAGEQTRIPEKPIGPLPEGYEYVLQTDSLGISQWIPQLKQIRQAIRYAREVSADGKYEWQQGYDKDGNRVEGDIVGLKLIEPTAQPVTYPGTTTTTPGALGAPSADWESVYGGVTPGVLDIPTTTTTPGKTYNVGDTMTDEEGKIWAYQGNGKWIEQPGGAATKPDRQPTGKVDYVKEGTPAGWIIKRTYYNDNTSEDTLIQDLSYQSPADIEKAKADADYRAWQQKNAADQAAAQAARDKADADAAKAATDLAQKNYLAGLAANPTSWLEYAMAKGEPAVVQPWMLPLMPEQYGMSKAGGIIPNWPGQPPTGTPPAATPPATGGGATYTDAEFNNAIAAANALVSAYQAQAISLAEFEAKVKPFRDLMNAYRQAQQRPAAGIPTAAGGASDFLQPVQDLTKLPSLTRPATQYQARMGPTAMRQYYGYQQAQTKATPEQTQFNLWNFAPPTGANRLLTRTYG